MFLKYLVSSIFFISLFFGAFSVNQADFFGIIGFLIPAFIAYLSLLFFANKEKSIRFFLIIAVFIRLIFLFSTPKLSDDYFRFIWDGRVAAEGLNPYEFKPEELINSFEEKGYEYLFEHLNSPKFHTIYPPFLQWIFKISALGGNHNISIELLILKLIYVTFSISLVFILPYVMRLYDLKQQQALIYLLNPLVIVEEMGNLHAEGIMVFFLALFLISLKLKPKLSFLPFTAAVVVKLTPFIILPALFFRLGIRNGIIYLFSCSLFLFFFFSPYLSGIIQGGFIKSIVLFFNKLEFNAFGYNIFKWVGYVSHGYNRIKWLGPLASLVSFSIIVCISFFHRKYEDLVSLPQISLVLYTTYLFFSPIIHPWYLIPLIFLSTFGRTNFVLIWSCLAFLSYSHYQNGILKENYPIIFFEYILVLYFLIWDLKRNRLALI